MTTRAISAADFSLGLVTRNSVQTTLVSALSSIDLGTTCQILATNFRYVEDFGGGGLGTTGNVGALGWRLAGTNSQVFGVTVTAAVTGHPGVLGLAPGATAAGNQSILISNAASQTPGVAIYEDIDEFMWIFNCYTTADEDVFIGIMNNTTSDPTAGVYLEIKTSTENQWRAVTRRSASSAERVNTSVAFTPNTWVNVYARRGTTGWIFNLNGTDLAEMDTHLPQNVLMQAALNINKDSAGTPGIGLDFFALIGTVTR